MFRCVIKHLKYAKINNRTFSSNAESKTYEPFYRFISNHDGLMALIEAEKLEEPNMEYPYYYMPDKTKQQEIIKHIAINGYDSIFPIIFFGSMRWFVISIMVGYIALTNIDENSQNDKRIIKSAVIGYISAGTYVVYSIIGPIPVFCFYSGAAIVTTIAKIRKS